MKNLIRKSVEAMDGYVPGEQPQGDKIIKLNTNENPWLCSPFVRDILNEIDVAELAKYPDPLCMDVRRVIAEKHAVGIGNVFAGNGSDEILALCIRAFAEHDGSVGYFDPSYSLYPVLAQIEEIETRPVELDKKFLWQMPENYSSSVFFLTNPNAPTGMLHPKENIENFIKIFSGVVVIDEAYADFARENCMEFAAKYENVLVARTLSKSYALAGIRFGYCVGAEPLIDALYKIKDSYNVNRLTQEIARVAILDEDTMTAITSAVKDSRALLTAELIDLGFNVYPSETNFVWTKPPKPGAKKIFDALRKKNIFVRWFDGQRTKEYLRITVGTNTQIVELAAALEEILGR
ncbi:MAG: histidinol-phosphate transaminase [Kiritimatiellales bacterium]